MNEIIYVVLEKVLEAVYFSLFLIIGKNIKEKRLLLICIMIFEYLMLKHFIKYDVWFQLIYTFMSFVNLKVLYKEKAQITDIFLFMFSSIILIFLSVIIYIPTYIIFNNYINIYVYTIILVLNRILMFSFIIIFKNKIYKLYNKFKNYWNRHKNPQKIRSLTIRNISIIIFNLMFWLINILMTFALLNRR